jgi:hypothetical protein
MRALALYVDLAPNSDLQPLNSAADAAVEAIGAENILIARCRMTTAGG